ncbi:hypothetical protein ZYGM_001074, partial [Zygosaccharomyces mellis]
APELPAVEEAPEAPELPLVGAEDPELPEAPELPLVGAEDPELPAVEEAPDAPELPLVGGDDPEGAEFPLVVGVPELPAAPELPLPGDVISEHGVVEVVESPEVPAGSELPELIVVWGADEAEIPELPLNGGLNVLVGGMLDPDTGELGVVEEILLEVEEVIAKSGFLQ